MGRQSGLLMEDNCDQRRHFFYKMHAPMGSNNNYYEGPSAILKYACRDQAKIPMIKDQKEP